jgi:hypothetical protein
MIALLAAGRVPLPLRSAPVARLPVNHPTADG